MCKKLQHFPLFSYKSKDFSAENFSEGVKKDETKIFLALLIPLLFDISIYFSFFRYFRKGSVIADPKSSVCQDLFRLLVLLFKARPLPPTPTEFPDLQLDIFLYPPRSLILFFSFSTSNFFLRRTSSFLQASPFFTPRKRTS